MKEKLKLLPMGLVHFPKKLAFFLKAFVLSIWDISNFSVLLIFYIFYKILSKTGNIPFVPLKLKEVISMPFVKVYNLVLNYNRRKEGSLNRLTLIDLALRNMRFKRSRTIITVGGMAVGVGSIVFLVSIGYGLQELVISRVARLDEMKQADVFTQPGSNAKITDKTLTDFKDITNVEKVLPLIAVVGRVNFQNSVSDMAVYGVTADYLHQSAIKPVQGTVFESNEIAMHMPANPVGEVAGVSTYVPAEPIDQSTIPSKYGEEIGTAVFSVQPGEWVRVRDKPDTKGKILGYTKRLEGQQSGKVVLGASYPESENGKFQKNSNNDFLGKWIEAPVLLWEETECEAENPECIEGQYKVKRDEEGAQVQQTGFFAQINITIESTTVKAPIQSNVLGVTSEDELILSDVLAASSSGGLDFIDIASESGSLKEAETKTVAINSSAKKEAVVNRAMLQILNIQESEAVGKQFKTSFVVVGGLTDSKEKIQSEETEYTIVGVTPGDKSPVFYVPFVDLRSLGITNYSQVKVVVNDKNNLADIRQRVEAQGFITKSVADTVNQINSLFGTARAILALLGMVALGIASLGMFNTLTVSLLERTREVGLMKAMGMRSGEVKELFLTESMIMGFFGGVLGITLGYIAGKILGLLLSVFAVVKGAGYIDITHLPIYFIAVIVFLSLLVGLTTGIYPARRATKISALNALRYE